MGRVLIGTEYGSYSFDPLARTITLKDIPNISMEQLLSITNVTDNEIIYLFSSKTLNGTIANNVITLLYDTTLMSEEDALQIYIDLENPSNIYELQPIIEQFTYDTNLEKVLGSQPLVDSGKLKSKVSFDESKVVGRIGASNEVIGIDCKGTSTISIQISGTWSGSIYFEGTTDGGTYVYTTCVLPLVSSGVGSYYTSSNGVFRVNISGMTRFQCRFGTWYSGTALITLISTSSQMTLPYDPNLYVVFGATALYRSPQVPMLMTPPTPTIPGSYSMPGQAYPQLYGQIFTKLRVEASGDQQQPFAQQQYSNAQKVVWEDLYRLMENIYLQLAMANQLEMIKQNLTFPNGWEEIK